MSVFLTTVPVEECFTDLATNPTNKANWVKILSVSDFLQDNWEALLKYSKALSAADLLEIHDIIRQKPYGKGVGRKLQRFFKNVLSYYSHFDNCEGEEAQHLKQLIKILHFKHKKFNYIFVPTT